jgi:hypothetical protein
VGSQTGGAVVYMNTIKRARLRPRRKSVNFRSLWWVVVREASLRVLFPSQIGSTAEHNARATCCDPDTAALNRCVGAVLEARPERRYWSS